MDRFKQGIKGEAERRSVQGESPGNFPLLLPLLVFSLFTFVMLFGAGFCSSSSAAPAPTRDQRLHDDLFGVSFADAINGWVCGRWGTVLHTSDGGTTWSPEKTGTDYTLSSITFLNDNLGWAVGDQGTILHTTDGGRTWAAQKCPVRYFLMGVCFVSPQKGWIVTERSNILYTDDGGRTWSVQFKGDDIILKAVSFYDEMNGWAVGEYGYIYHTKDGGKSWVKDAGFFRMSSQTGNIEAGNTLFSVEATGPDSAWAAGIDGTIEHTVDGDAWTKVKGPSKREPLFGIAANAAGHIIICGKFTLFASADGGKTWQRASLQPSFTYGWLYRLARKGRSGFVSLGQQGAVYLSKGHDTLSWSRAKN